VQVASVDTEDGKLAAPIDTVLLDSAFSLKTIASSKDQQDIILTARTLIRLVS